MGSVASLHVYPVKGCRGLSLSSADVEPWGLAGDRRWLVVDETGRFISQREEPRLATVTAALTADGLTLSADGLPTLDVSTPATRSPATSHPGTPTLTTPGAATLTPVTWMSVRIWRSEVDAALADQSAHEWFANLLGRNVRLVYLDDPRRRAVNQEYGRPGETVTFADGYPLLLTNVASLEHLNGWMVEPLPMNRFRPNLVVAGFDAWAEDTWRRIVVGGVSFRVVKPCDRCIVTTTDQLTGERPAHEGPAEPLRTLAAYRRFPGGLMFGQNLIPDAPGTIRVGDPVETTQIT